MSLYGYHAVNESEELRPSQTLYPSAGSTKRATTLFDMDDIDDMSDLENMNFSQFSRPTGSQQAEGYHLARKETKGKRSVRSLSFNLAEAESPPVGSVEMNDRDATKYHTPAPRESHLRSETTTRVKFSPDDPDNPHTGMAMATTGKASTETPAFKHPSGTQGSTVTTRWKQRGRLGRLGLAKPRRNGPVSDEHTGQMEASPPGILDFFSGDADSKPLFASLARSPKQHGPTGADSEGSQRRSPFAADDSVDYTVRQRSGVDPFDAAGQLAADNSDVSMASNPRSPSPDAPASRGSLSGSASRSHRDVAKEPVQDARQAVSPLLGGRGAASMEALSQQAMSPGQAARHSSPRLHASPVRRPASFLSTPQMPVPQEKRVPESAADISTRFQQYERRMNDSSPYRPPPRAGSGVEPDMEPVVADQDARHQPKAQSARMAERPAPRDMGYASPRLSGRRTGTESNNFEALRKSSMLAAAGDGEEPQPQPQPQPQTQTQPQQVERAAAGDSSVQQYVVGTKAEAPAQAADTKRVLTVNGRVYQKLSITGRGGSSKVYKALSAKHEVFAIKRVSFARADVAAIEGYMNEILLLRRFAGNAHIIQLFDAEISKERGVLHMVMECGETDLASVLKRQGERPLGLNTLRVYWEQMLRAVLTIHDARVVHADLKPANYLLVRGALKLIDFGIAKAIGNDTTNIHRENQIGTVNYMSPEAIQETNTEGRRLMKLGRASDIWSLGIILYQMCYGRTPFAQLALFKKLASIPDPTFAIPFPPFMAGSQQTGALDPNATPGDTNSDGSAKTRVPPELLRAMHMCLQRDPARRAGIPELLREPLLCPVSLEHALPRAMAQMLDLLKRSPQVLDQWGVSDAQNDRILASLARTLHEQEQSLLK
ncbi:Dual-specificity kinase, spindle pole body (SPB) duplication and spindle checkpoint function [Coemansia spiralis]|uniref:Dual-specificity kinase, spindle pole body (SPB) duplication and spindle checkpoint function n=2 Tax=Coemansia TaxID=4863 RepID=A0A9W8G5Y5_9FUNG|nr:Dual-specificity kinase, spindle pole body (SPB) duplication and spindle checkpoint function [Coemansia umbellata]KAJ2621009.1 Dual-specificity kinase, spindle pole body (SPB) duplication and spindle checkpoint function [Coemansia sp. RSA 1358]KAJ2675758.1 Dual-specificity kinase, spindle pole body (SPB) duplication and spindle checkpoint function [Coemansia spiralis]